MTALPPAVSALETRLGLDAGTLAGADLARAAQALTDAVALVLAEAPMKATAWRLNAPDIIVTTVLDVAQRRYENPSGTKTEQLGEHMVTVEATGRALAPDEVTRVRRAAGLTGIGFTGSIRTPVPWRWPADAAFWNGEREP
jgi:hypothetical protein